MITLEQFLKITNYRITSGGEFLWTCYGSSVYNFDSEVFDEYSASIYFDTATQEVFEIDVLDIINDRQYRWINPKFTEAFSEEVIARGLEENNDLLKYTVIEVDYDILEKLTGIINKTEYDTRIVIEIEMTNEDFQIYAKAAHEMDVTLNQFIEIAITAVLGKPKLGSE